MREAVGRGDGGIGSCWIEDAGDGAGRHAGVQAAWENDQQGLRGWGVWNIDDGLR